MILKVITEEQFTVELRRIMSMKNSNDTIGNRNRDLPTGSTALQPTAAPRTPFVTE
jgi:hypothetical protein